MSESALFTTTYATLCSVGVLCGLGVLILLLLMRSRKLSALAASMFSAVMLCIPPTAGIASMRIGRWFAHEHQNYGFFGERIWGVLGLCGVYGVFLVLSAIGFLVVLFTRPARSTNFSPCPTP